MNSFRKIFILIFLFVGCAKVPISERRQLNMLPESSMMSMSLSSYRSFLSKNSVVSDSDERTQMVKRVGARISSAVKTFMAQKNFQKELKDTNGNLI